MDEELKIYWWNDFCNRCKSEECKSCEKPIFELGTDRLLSPPNKFENLIVGVIYGWRKKIVNG